ncbi:cleavage stimulation factor subunit 3 [Tieghemostelium lacteum]|uniref:Cleavage stimulation factor subunit 3 n=1 Tax=Tieghemostelium lacteum TaxID=361077 RepID=A0A151Z4S8_TIELA|nr:cleavage stimulation factor subunit 3 [Tieghemostelium lacteum]|eukprot:KYQ88973.1 cleavage stimulation factor subunit 3 [Tieghemostelium lacteum]
METQNENINIKVEPNTDDNTSDITTNSSNDQPIPEIKNENLDSDQQQENQQQEEEEEKENKSLVQTEEIKIPIVKKEEEQEDDTKKVKSPTSSSSISTTITGTLQPTTSQLINQPKKSIQIEILENRISIDLYDTEAWTLLLGEIQSQPIDNCRAIYERFLGHFTTAGKYWKVYAEQEMQARNYDLVEKIFFRSLRNVRNVELWRTYITYIRQHKSQNQREEIIKAFEFALEFVGMDISSTQIWMEYLNFLKEEKTNNTFEEGQKMTNLRKLYQRAVENPMHDLDIIWKEYDQFENSINKVLAKSLLQEHHQKYQHAKSVYRERKSLLEGILRNMLAKPPGSSDKEEHQVRLWRKLLAYEKSNPQKFEQATLRNRIAATYNQCLLCLYHYPDIWYEAAVYQAETGSWEGSNQFFEKAIQALPKSLFLHFAYADSLEGQKKIPQAKELYEKLIASVQPVDPLVWIQYMRFARRTERIEGPRKIFKRAKASPECTYHVYIALSLIEYYVNQDPKMARDIFEIGLKKFPLETPYINFCIEFLSNLNEENNTRVLFEKVLLLPNHENKTIDLFWRKYLDFEYRQNQDIQSIQKLEKRYLSSFYSSNINSLDKSGVLQALNRYKFLNLSPCPSLEIEVISKNLQPSDGDDNSTQQQKDSESGQHQNLKEGKGKKQKKDKYQQQQQNESSSTSNISTTSYQNPDNPEKPTSSTIIPVSNWKVKRPDITNMLPYRGELSKFNSNNNNNNNNNSNNNNMIGNQNNSPTSRSPQFDIPEFLFPLLQILPASSSFNGPLVDVDFLLMTIKDSPLPIINPNMGQQIPQQQQSQPQQQPPLTLSPTTSTSNNLLNSPTNVQMSNISSPTVQQPMQPSSQPQQNPHKRKLEDEDQISQPQPQTQSYSFQNTKPPTNDLYRKRQASKLSKKA